MTRLRLAELIASKSANRIREVATPPADIYIDDKAARAQAEAILHAGRARRGEISAAPPLDVNSTDRDIGVAAMIVICGKIRRGKSVD